MNLPEILLNPSSSSTMSSPIGLISTQTQTSNGVGVIHDKPITDLALKTPISFLQEICFRIHATPTYSLCPSEAQSNSSEPAFLYRVVVDDMIAFGKGSSKKRAKHRAAWVMIEQCYSKLKLTDDPLVQTIEQYFTLKPLHSNTTADDSMNNGEKSNPIGKLQELTQKNWIRPPEYEFSDLENSSSTNSKMYACRAKVATYTAEGKAGVGIEIEEKHRDAVGTGLSKKIAKRQAATNLLNVLENLDPEAKKALLNRPEGQNESEYSQSHPKYRRSRRKVNDSSLLDTSGVRGSGSVRSNRLHDKSSFQMMKNSDLPFIKRLLSDHEDLVPLSESYPYLEDLAREQNFTLEFIQLPMINENGIQLLLELRLMPVSVFHGSGETFEHARNQASNMALKYIRYLSRQQQQQQQSHSASSTIVTTPLLAQTA